MLRDYINPAYTDVSNGIEHTYQTILDAFDIDDAVGVQLDIIGSFVGLPRPSFSSIGLAGFFGFDSLPNQPFDTGEFADGRVTEDALVNDEKYRGYIKIKIAKNVWDGTRVGLKALLANAVDADTIVINNVAPPVILIGFQFDIPGAGWDDGFFEGGVLGQSTPANYQIIFSGGTITQEEVDQLLLLDLFPTPQGVNQLSVTVV